MPNPMLLVNGLTYVTLVGHRPFVTDQHVAQEPLLSIRFSAVTSCAHRIYDLNA
jgi:hypothetical protein